METKSEVDWNARYVYADYIPDLTSAPEMPNARIVELKRCVNLRKCPDLPEARIVRIHGSRWLRSLPKMPNAVVVSVLGCDKVIAEWKRERLIPLLTATGMRISDLLSLDCWDCHQWENCPMAAVFETEYVSLMPKQWRQDAAIFVGLFDQGLITRDAVQNLASLKRYES